MPCMLAELLEAVGLGEVGQRFILLSPKLKEIVCLGSGLCHLLECCLLLVDWMGLHQASRGLPSPVVPALQPAGTRDHG